ncbi:MAG: 2,4-dienoyl-CoA reductase (NADPH2) [Actinobacteria bacterium]|jgi:2,4-dienoyl-CoA reductase-like NADH-dependent reductase (Old Yellow Enzyme family)|nr:2,4-dienoyl-CoA reductase (NADPH2) [Actinomycetota bacterium]
MNTLFDPLTIGSVIFQNRVWVSPMCQYSAIDGLIGEWHRAHLNSFATGSPGLIMVEATGVVPEGRISIACTSLHSQAHAEAFIPMIGFAHSQNVKMGIQLAHAGRKASTMRPWDDHRMATIDEGGWQSVSSSAIAFHGYPEPRALTIDEIHQLTQDFVAAAKRAITVGFDVIEIHAAHGYLFHQFYSPLANTRSDEYGGSFENRTRFLLETTKAVRDAIPRDTPLFVRISATDWVDDGWNLVDSIELCSQLKAVGVDLIDVSTGGNVHNAPIKATPGFQVPFAAAIRTEVQIMTTAVGLITEPEQAQYIIETGEADAVFLARAMIRNPRWALNAAEKLGVKIEWPHQLERGQSL